MVVRRKLPGHVIVRRFSIFRIMLRRQQIHCVVAIRLIETHDVGSSRKASFLDLNRRLRACDFDVLSHQSPYHGRHTSWIALILWNQKRIRWLRQTFLPRVPGLLVEVVQHFFGFASRLVQRCKRAGFLIIQDCRAPTR